MKFFFRCDASYEIGTGHVMRCLTLAGYLADYRAEVFFICREEPGNLCGYIEAKGYRVYRLPCKGYNGPKEGLPGQSYIDWEADAGLTSAVLKKEVPADWIVIDHYSLDRRWESNIRRHVKNIMVIDDLANRPHDCDILLDQNYYRDMESRYKGLTPLGCRMMLGPEYALLRPEFKEARKKERQRDGSVGRILVFFGGSDPTNETEKALYAIRRLKRKDISADVVVGGGNPRKEKIRTLCSAMNNVTFHCQVDNMAEIMAQSDLSLGAGGSAMWERCFLGLPTLVIVTAENQLETSEAVTEEGAIRLLGRHDEVDEATLYLALHEAVSNPHLVKVIGKNSLKLMGNVVLSGEMPVVSALLEESNA